MSACAHCGLPVEGGSGEAAGAAQDASENRYEPGDPVFCCPGCAAAYGMVRGLGLDAYYERRLLDPTVRPLKPDPQAPAATYQPFIRDIEPGAQELHLMVDGLHCAACVWLIESVLTKQPGVTKARLNMTTRRLTVAWRAQETAAEHLIAAVSRLGYHLMPYDPERLQQAERRQEHALLKAMAVTGFAAGNVMLMSIAVWAGHSQGMGEATRGLLHWLSALVALPAIAYGVRPFARSAVQALTARRTNMDVPITVAVVLTAVMSLSETMRGGPYAYFDSALALLFFLLIGRVLDQRARGRARSAAEHLAGLQSTSVRVRNKDGTLAIMLPDQVPPGALVVVAAGERVPVDGSVATGVSDVDMALVTGESLPTGIHPGDRVFAGTLNLTGPLELTMEAAGEATLLATIVRLMEQAEQGRARFVVLADRVARLYTPIVHALAALTFAGWYWVGGVAWQEALLYAVAVLIITCPCALALAVPVVQVVAAGRLMRLGVLLKSPTALERFAQIDTLVFDKTGTLTEGRLEPSLEPIDEEALKDAAALAGASRHPLAVALAALAESRIGPIAVASSVRERPGLGLELDGPCGPTRLGNRRFVFGDPANGGTASDTDTDTDSVDGESESGPELWLDRPGHAPVRFAFRDRLRADAARTIDGLKKKGYRIVLLSGDRSAAVAEAARRAGIDLWHAEHTPGEKVERLERWAAQGWRCLMVGDGINDAPALAAAHASLSPASAADISQNAADAVFQGLWLVPVAWTLTLAGKADAIVRQNLSAAILYNCAAVPLAVAGLVTPLIAAIAMSTSSLVVTINAMRLMKASQTAEYADAGSSRSNHRRDHNGSDRLGGVPVGSEVRSV